METEAPKNAPIMDLAFKRAANFAAHSRRRKDGFYNMRRWIAILGVLATLAAILTQVYGEWIKAHEGIGLVARILFVATPVAASLAAAFASKKYANGDWWITRAAAEEIKKNIYFYRTIWPKDKRNEMLENSLKDLQRQVYRGLGGVFSLEEPKPKSSSKSGKKAAPQAEQPQPPARDPGVGDLTADQYFKYRLEDQLNWHNKKILELKQERDRMTIVILLVGALGTVLATLGQDWGIWVALTASITAALIGWEQLKSIEGVIRNYSKVVLELSILRDHWQNTEPAKLKPEEFENEFKNLVEGCEAVLWAQNAEYIKAMQQALKENDLEEKGKLVTNTIEEGTVSIESVTKAVEDNAIQTINATLVQGSQQIQNTYQTTLGELQQDASTLVQKQLDAVSQAVTEAAGNLVESAPTLTSVFDRVKQAYSDVEVGRDTSKEQLNEILASYPKTGEVKG